MHENNICCSSQDS